MSDEPKSPAASPLAGRVWRVKIEEIDGEAYLTIPDEIADELGLVEGSEMIWTIEDGKVSIAKA
jgi:bifunctional DNA-binding transcriptional regulator/antitoxin component of YhaV-PrlF toxin-antitoxin module